VSTSTRFYDPGDVNADPKHSTEANQRNSPLLRLPAELRNQIYELVLRHDCLSLALGRYLNLQPIRLYPDPGSRTLALLRVCRQDHFEAALLPYSLNTFVFTRISVAKGFQDLCTPVQLHVVEGVELYTQLWHYVKQRRVHDFSGGRLQVCRTVHWLEEYPPYGQLSLYTEQWRCVFRSDLRRRVHRSGENIARVCAWSQGHCH
jgi:hypothetical protein